MHPGTASRALNEEVAARGLVNDETARRVRDAAKQLDYHPNPAARSLKTRRSHTIGVLIPDIANPLFPPIVRGIEDRLAQSGYVALLGNTDSDLAREQMLLRGMRSRHVDGLILATARRRDALVEEGGDDHAPVVLVNRVTEDHTLPSVSTDDVSGIRMAVAHLVDLGHRHIGHIAGPAEYSTGAGRHRGFVVGMEAAGLLARPDHVVFAERFSISDGLRCARQLLTAPGPLTAVVAANDMLALGCCQAIAEAGLRCPADISVVGFNDMPFCDRVSPPLTSVRFPHYQVGVEAAQLVLERIAQPGAPTKVLFLPPELVVRASSGPPAQGKRRSGRLGATAQAGFKRQAGEPSNRRSASGAGR